MEKINQFYWVTISDVHHHCHPQEGPQRCWAFVHCCPHPLTLPMHPFHTASLSSVHPLQHPLSPEILHPTSGKNRHSLHNSPTSHSSNPVTTCECRCCSLPVFPCLWMSPRLCLKSAPPVHETHHHWPLKGSSNSYLVSLLIVVSLPSFISFSSLCHSHSIQPCCWFS